MKILTSAEEVDLKQRLRELNIYENIAEKVELQSDWNTALLETLQDSKEQLEFCFTLLFGLTKDQGIALIGLLYTLSKSDNRFKSIIDEFSEEVDKRSKDIFKTLKKIDGHLSRQKFSYDIDDTFEASKTVMMIFITISEEQDILPLIIELVYRLSVLKYLKNIKSEQELEYFSIETFKIFVPIANRLGVWRVKWLLEDLSFKAFETGLYKKISTLINETRIERDAYIAKLIDELEIVLKMEGLNNENFEINGRPKNIYSTFTKMKQLYAHSQGIKTEIVSFKEFKQEIQDSSRFEELFRAVHDLYGIRIICDSILNCYVIQDIVQASYPRLSTYIRNYRQIIDYIAAPKDNKYRSIHLVILGPNDKAVEIQIRDREMHLEAEYGVAAHWKYKEKVHGKMVIEKAHVFSELKIYMDKHGLSEAQKFLKENDIFGSKIYIFTRDNEIKAIKKGSTPVDFAYSIHSEVGDRCSGSLVNGQIVPLKTVLQNGDIVEIKTKNHGHPSEDWLSFVKTSKARGQIRAWLKRNFNEKNADKISRGKDIIEQELRKNKLSVQLKSKLIEGIALKLNYKDSESLFFAVGNGARGTAEKIVEYLRNSDQNDSDDISEDTPLENKKIYSAKTRATSYQDEASISELDHLANRLARCCSPVNGDPIVGTITRGQITIHRKECPNLKRIPNERTISLNWEQSGTNQNKNQLYLAKVRIYALDRMGLLKEISTRIEEKKINISDSEIKQIKTSSGLNLSARIDLCLEVTDAQQLETCIAAIRKIKNINSVRRFVEGG